MVFHGGQPSGKKKAIIGRRQKQGNTFRVYQQAISNAEAVAAPEDEADHPNPAVEPMEGPPRPLMIALADGIVEDSFDGCSVEDSFCRWHYQR